MTNQTPRNIPEERGSKILKMLFQRNRANHSADNHGPGAIDTYQSLKKLKEMLKGGQITENEYEEIKIELLTR